MSVDIAQLTANLDPQRREAVKTQYEERAVSPTAAFLLCFFLGSTGAHRFYLREWRVGFAHLGVFLVGAVTLIAGLVQTLPLTRTTLSAHPAGLSLDVIGLLILLAALIWEIIDLGRIDHQVYQRNLLLAEGIIAGTLLADHTVVEKAHERLDALTHGSAVPVAAAGAAAAASAGVITAEHVADARALAEESGGLASVSYQEVSQFNVSADSDEARNAEAEAARQGNWTESETTSEEQAAEQESAAPLTVEETVTRTHLEDGAHTTDSYEVDRYSHPSAGEIAGLGAAGLGAAGLGAGLYEAGQYAGFDEPTQPDVAQSTAPAEEESAAFDSYDDIGDVTDAALPAIVLPAADIAEASSTPTYVQLPEEPAAEAPLYLIPEEEPATAAYSAEPEPAAPEAYTEPAPKWPGVSTYEPATEPEPAHAEEWGAAAGLAGLAGAGVLGAEALAHSHPAEPVAEPVAGAAQALESIPAPSPEPSPEPTPEPEPVVAAEPPKMKRIRVRRKVVVDGEVVAEEVVEREVPADMDSAEAARQIQAELSHATPEQIAKLAHLSPDEEVQLSQRSEGLGAQ